MEKTWQVRLLCPWVRHLTGLFLHLSDYRLVLSGGRLTHRSKRYLWSVGPLRNSFAPPIPAIGKGSDSTTTTTKRYHRCLMVEVFWQINEQVPSTEICSLLRVKYLNRLSGILAIISLQILVNRSKIHSPVASR